MGQQGPGSSQLYQDHTSRAASEGANIAVLSQGARRQGAPEALLTALFLSTLNNKGGKRAD